MSAFTFVFSSLLLLYNLVAGESCKNHLSEYGFALVDHMYQSFTAHSLASCYIACNIEPACQSLNYNLADKMCEFNNDTKYYRAKYFVEKATSVYADNPDPGQFQLMLVARDRIQDHLVFAHWKHSVKVLTQIYFIIWRLEPACIGSIKTKTQDVFQIIILMFVQVMAKPLVGCPTGVKLNKTS